jgi:hypothetical protein
LGPATVPRCNTTELPRRFHWHFYGPEYSDRILDLACGLRAGISPLQGEGALKIYSTRYAVLFFHPRGRNSRCRSYSAADPVLSDLEVGFTFALLLFALLQFAVRGNPSPFSAAAHRFAGFSYSLYVLHFPFLLFFRAWLVPAERWQPTPPRLLCAAAVGAGSLLYAWLISRFTEAKTDVARRRVNRLLGQASNISSSPAR